MEGYEDLILCENTGIDCVIVALAFTVHVHDLHTHAERCQNECVSALLLDPTQYMVACT